MLITSSVFFEQIRKIQQQQLGTNQQPHTKIKTPKTEKCQKKPCISDQTPTHQTQCQEQLSTSQNSILHPHRLEAPSPRLFHPVKDFTPTLKGIFTAKSEVQIQFSSGVLSQFEPILEFLSRFQPKVGYFKTFSPL